MDENESLKIALAKLLAEVENIAVFLEQQVSSGKFPELLYRQKITKFLDAYHEYHRG
jgi:hypothetical protein